MKDVTIIIVTYNSAAHITDCLNSIKGQKVIIVDNNSTDDTIDICSNSDAVLIENPCNLGYAKAVNIGLKKVKTKYALLINPDVLIEVKAIKEMIRFMAKNPDCDIQGPKLINNRGKLLYSCHRFPTFNSLLGRRLGLFKRDVKKYLMKDFDHETAIKVDWVSGGCMLFRTAICMDERYFLYFEDVDLCVGRNVYYNPKAIAIHEAQRQSARNIVLFIVHSISYLKFRTKHAKVYKKLVADY
ncbi:glycosyltransferase family 2 protein [Candidatus Woesearchaeota archaeon]|nr:glycosyltransferase family 2 protein [Candidatus Woesearchaeota archaeon]